MRKLGNTLYYPCRKPERMTVAGEWTDSAATIQSRDWLGWHPASSPAPCWCWNSVAAKEFSYCLLTVTCSDSWVHQFIATYPGWGLTQELGHVLPACLCENREGRIVCPVLLSLPLLPVTCLASLLTTSPLFPVVSHEPRPSLHLSRHQLHVNGITQAAFPCRSHL